MTASPARPPAPPLPADPLGATPPGGSATGVSTAPPASFLEVRVGPGRLDIVEFGGRDRAAALREALLRLGLVTEEEFRAPCG